MELGSEREKNFSLIWSNDNVTVITSTNIKGVIVNYSKSTFYLHPGLHWVTTPTGSEY